MARAPGRRSCRRHTTQLPLERGDVPLVEAPLPTGLEGGQDTLAGELVDRVGTEIEDLCHLPTVQQCLVPFEHVPCTECVVASSIQLAGPSRRVKNLLSSTIPVGCA